MDLPNGGRGLVDEGIQNSQKGKKQYSRHTIQQVQHLETFYRGCPHPDMNQRQQLGRELGLDPKQIKFWFQNKRTNIKAKNKKADSNSLRTENEKIRTENLEMQAAQKTIMCRSCASSCRGGDEHNTLLQLRRENMRLKKEHEQAIIAFSDDLENLALPSPVAPHWLGGIPEMDKSNLLEGATNELFDNDGVIETPEGQRNIMKLSHRMFTNFCEECNLSDNGDFPHILGCENGGVRVSIRNSTKEGELKGFVMSVASSIWLPLLKENLFEFLNDEKKRGKWDLLSGGNPVSAISLISSGAHLGNCISLIQPLVPGEPNLLTLQESRIDSRGAVIIYAPMDLQTIVSVANGEDYTKTQILPSGFIISGDGGGRYATGASSSSSTNTFFGSILTVAYQILVCRGQLTQEKKMESVATVCSMISSTIQKIKVALGVSDSGH